VARKIEWLEIKYGGQFQVVFEAIRQLISAEEKLKRKIGYITES
jgi:predicted 3-demethylubiquinone-9 3-methyltransferase (glyoxalase superfamily)